MKAIQLTKGQVAIVDDDDFEHLAQWRWSCSSASYAVRSIMKNGKATMIFMHREVLKLPGVYEVDHKNGNGLDNRRCNLRKASRSQQCMNQRVSKRNKFGAKGVCWHKGARKYMAQISSDGKHHYLGLFDTVEAAKMARDRMAEVLHGEFFRT